VRGFSAGFKGNKVEIAVYRGITALSESMRVNIFLLSYAIAKITGRSPGPLGGIFGVQLPRSRGLRRRVAAIIAKDRGPVGQQHMLRASIFRSCPNGRALNRVPS
jgi:hypothetical protein